MTVTSINHNPGNESKYARHRSIWKGRHNQLALTIARLRGTSGITIFDYDNRFAFSREWGVTFQADRMPPTKRSQILCRWEVQPPSQRMLNVLSRPLQADLKLLWEDFVTVVARRIGKSDGVGHNGTEDRLVSYTGKNLLVFAYSPDSFDLIVSKYGDGENLTRNHHFFQWQARTKGFDGLVHVDDYEAEEGLTLYVAT